MKHFQLQQNLMEKAGLQTYWHLMGEFVALLKNPLTLFILNIKFIKDGIRVFYNFLKGSLKKEAIM